MELIVKRINILLNGVFGNKIDMLSTFSSEDASYYDFYYKLECGHQNDEYTVDVFKLKRNHHVNIKLTKIIDDVEYQSQYELTEQMLADTIYQVYNIIKLVIEKLLIDIKQSKVK